MPKFAVFNCYMEKNAAFHDALPGHFTQYGRSAIPAGKEVNPLNLHAESKNSLRKPFLQPVDYSAEKARAGIAGGFGKKYPVVFRCHKLAIDDPLVIPQILIASTNSCDKLATHLATYSRKSCDKRMIKSKVEERKCLNQNSLFLIKQQMH